MTTVIRLISIDDARRHRAVLCDWIRDNGVDPAIVSGDSWISIEQDGTAPTVIRYTAFKTTPDGRKIVDPDAPDAAWTEQRTTPLLVSLPPL